jgi:hypothetical protein
LKADAQQNAGAKTPKENHPLARRRRGRPANNPPGTPHNRAQRNFTDSDSRLMKTQDGGIQGYIAQAVVDAAH